MTVKTTRVELLTAEVRTLMIGDRQVTMSIFNQLDWADPETITPLGRVHSKAIKVPAVEVVGTAGGVLVRAHLLRDRGYSRNRKWRPWKETDDRRLALRAEWESLPLIVLAGLR